ncbi:hypothetical protein PQX77_012798, partial [Marasmius sp. AFHP31]
MSTYFANAEGTSIGDHANFQTVAGNSTTNIYNNHERLEDRVTFHGRTVRKIIDGDINYQHVLSSKVIFVDINTHQGPGASKNLSVKVKRVVQTARLYGHRGTFTTTTLEPVDEKDREQFKEIKKIVLEAAMSQRLALLKQVFAVTESNGLTLIAHDATELATGHELANRYKRKDMIVYYYLFYTSRIAIQSLRGDETVTFPVTNRWSDWSINLKTRSWHYDPASVSLVPPGKEQLQVSHFPRVPLRHDTLPQLDANKIIACVEKDLGDALYLITSLGRRWRTDLSGYVQHGLLTFGVVVDYNKPGILAHFPQVSASSPEWFCESFNRDVRASYSSSVPSRIDISFNPTDLEAGGVQVNLDFGLRTPAEVRNRLRCAFLCQSIQLCDDFRDMKYVVYIDQLGFRLKGTFLDDATSRATPIYLFVRPLPTEFIHNVRCVRYPLPEPLFYWSHDPEGREVLAEDDWEKYGIPELSVEEWISTYWQEEQYTCVREYLCLRGYNLDGKRCSYEHEYPELIF